MKVSERYRASLNVEFERRQTQAKRVSLLSRYSVLQSFRPKTLKRNCGDDNIVYSHQSLSNKVERNTRSFRKS